MSEITMPLPPNLGNRRTHWRQNLGQKKAYWAMLDLLRLARAIEAPPAKPPSHVRISAAIYCWSPMDDDNVMARLKWSLDWLVGNGYLADDGRAAMTWTGIPTQQIDRRDPRIVFQLEAE